MNFWPVLKTKGRSLSSREVSAALVSPVISDGTLDPLNHPMSTVTSTTATVHPVLREDKRDHVVEVSKRPVSLTMDDRMRKGGSAISILVSGKIPNNPSMNKTPEVVSYRPSSGRDAVSSLGSQSSTSCLFEVVKSRAGTPFDKLSEKTTTFSVENQGSLKTAREHFILGPQMSDIKTPRPTSDSPHPHPHPRLFLSVPTTKATLVTTPRSYSPSPGVLRYPVVSPDTELNGHFNSSNVSGYRYAGVERLANRSSIYDASCPSIYPEYHVVSFLPDLLVMMRRDSYLLCKLDLLFPVFLDSLSEQIGRQVYSLHSS